MKEQDLLESFSGISEDLLKRSEDNKKLGSNEKTAAGKGNGKAGNAWQYYCLLHVLPYCL